MTPSDATARAERLINLWYVKTQADTEIMAGDQESLKNVIAAALLEVQRETREACVREIMDRATRRHPSPYAWMSRVALEDAAQAIREGQR